ncbi:hypothetical protein QTA58_23445 [Neorhizobium sp. CSC1952]|uniref:hypothetical protein n=1 Tax=Neorhizobium sp. CSC1952 TaxID=2978974 RepID=UPI0025A6068E|nr:hypothetical protein [Rhizobium sp. CSC1952]WJR67097.1 hypothetical protein QTA58_23445 [Rhizobium sp. CSC1952]
MQITQRLNPSRFRAVSTTAFALFLTACSGSSTIEGKYRADDGAGSTAEFMSDGTLIFISGGQQGVWKWAKLDGDCLKLDPGSGLPGTKSAVCGYSVLANGLRLTNCHLAMTLTRL